MITVYGTLCLDRLHRVPHLPKPGGYVEIEQTESHLGGEAYNTAYCLRTWHHDHKIIANTIGHGPEAQLIQTLLQKEGINGIQENQSQTTPVCDIYVTPDSERTMFGIGFADLQNFSNLEQTQLIEGAWFTADPNLASASIQFAQAAQTKGARIYYMDFPTHGDSAPQYSPVDIWQNSTDRFGKKGDLQANLAAIESAYNATGCLCFLTDGKNGFVVCGPNQPATHYPPFRAPDQIDSTGAGDCFRAGMLHGLDNALPLSDALAFAAAAASLACQGFGATASIPTVEQVQALIASQPQTLLTYRQLSS